MGLLHGPQDRRRKAPPRKLKPGRLPKWASTKLSRVERVIDFLESLPITKGIYAGHSMKLLPSQREFVQTIYGRETPDGRRQIRLAIKSVPRGNGKTDCWPAWRCVICADLKPNRAAKFIPAPITNCRLR